MDKAIEDRVNEAKQIAFARFNETRKRLNAMRHLICPDCGGNLIMKSGFLKSLIMKGDSYQCTACGRAHFREYGWD